jgi:hypothetical protein
MHLDLATFISSLLDNRFSVEDPRIPDGLCDLSSLVDPLVPVTRKGRALSSHEDYSHATFVGQLLARLFPREATKEQLECGIIALVFLFQLTVDTAVELHGDTTTEELLMMALNQDSIRQLKRILGATPCTASQDGAHQPNLASLPMFADARPVTDSIINGFIKRHLAPHLPTFFADDEDTEPSEDQLPHPGTVTRLSEMEDAPELEDLEADALDGWDEIHEHFMDNHYVQYEMGRDLDDILSTNGQEEPPDQGWSDDLWPDEDE